MELFPSYCIDTNALIDLWRRYYPPDIFPSLWEKLEKLISDGYLIAPREVFRELESQDDELLEWAKKRKGMFKVLDRHQVSLVKDILKNFPKLVDVNKTIPDADPFVIALVKSKGGTVFTSEQPANLYANPGARPKIPDVCKHYKVKCIHRFPEFFREQKWEF